MLQGKFPETDSGIFLLHVKEKVHEKDSFWIINGLPFLKKVGFFL